MAKLEWLTLPANLVSLGHCAFWSCSALKHVEPLLPSSLTTWGGSQIFLGCPLSGRLVLSNPVLASVPAEAFYGARGLREIDLSGSGVASIGTFSFRDCTSVTNVYFPGTLNVFGKDAFYGCSSLRSIYFQSMPSAFHSQAFEGVLSKMRIVVPETNVDWMDFFSTNANFIAWDSLSPATQANYTFDDACAPYGTVKIGSAGTTVFVATAPLQDVVLKVETTPDDADLLAATSPTCLGNTVVEVPYTNTVPLYVSGTDRYAAAVGYTLYKADASAGWVEVETKTGVTEAVLPADTPPGNYLLRWTFNTLGYSLTVRDFDETFGEVTLPDPNVAGASYAANTSINIALTETDGVFAQWTGDVPSADADKKSFSLTMDAPKTIAPSFLWKHFSASNTLSDGDWSFTTSGSNALTVTGISQQGLNPFVDLARGIDDPAKSIVALNAAFGTASGSHPESANITRIDLPDTVLTIGNYAFRQLPNLKKVVMPARLASLGHCLFYQCAALEEVTPFLPVSLVDVGTATFSDCASLRGDLVIANRECVELRSSVNGQFYGTKLTSVDLIGSSITNIGENAFRYAPLTNAVLPKTLERVEHCAFYGACGKLSALYFEGGPPIVASAESFTGWSELSCRIFIPRGNVAWDDYLAAVCSPLDLSVSEKEAFTAKFPGARMPSIKIKLGGYGNYQYLCRWSPGVASLIWLR